MKIDLTQPEAQVISSALAYRETELHDRVDHARTILDTELEKEVHEELKNLHSAWAKVSKVESQ